ncbi:hypothetical protein [Candidatus Igneacidithiobacillus taiwanensis]|uniref:hypothetical protein n=1 Tax=Candidatus Igneacidithiobacillus taiwanensis TaxID=1945924 RepID=UPI00289EF1AB|nr:hypothetical protein [Candidatus Igneacidithiobacillus taiwanensis]
MPVEKFQATVQYNDFKGSAAADRTDQDDINNWLEKNGLKRDGEFLLGISFFAGENYGEHKEISVEFLFATQGEHNSVKEMIEAHNGPVFVRRVTTDMPIAQFLGLFKRFSVSLSPRGMLDGRDYTYVE